MTHTHAHTHRDDQWEVDEYEVSLVMSSYLVAFAITKFSNITARSAKYDVLVQVVARPDAIANGDGAHALKEAATIVDFFSDYFNQTYPLKHTSKKNIALFF